jgi:hypothetical protein
VTTFADAGEIEIIADPGRRLESGPQLKVSSDVSKKVVGSQYVGRLARTVVDR